MIAQSICLLVEPLVKNPQLVVLVMEVPWMDLAKITHIRDFLDFGSKGYADPSALNLLLELHTHHCVCPLLFQEVKATLLLPALAYIQEVYTHLHSLLTHILEPPIACFEASASRGPTA